MGIARSVVFLTAALFLLSAAPAHADNLCKPAAPAPQSKCNKTSQCCAGLVCQEGRCRSACPIGTACNDGNACTYDDMCTAGGCAGTPVTCTSDQCNTRACNGTQTCTVTPLSGTPCSDGNACTSNDTCNAGQCVMGPQVTCPEPSQCVPSEQCLVPGTGTCDPSTGQCSKPNKPDGTLCEDGNLCTPRDNCQAGVCTSGGQVDCQCHEAGSTCDPTTGQCSNAAKPNFTPCDDGSLCATDEVCYNGRCEGIRKNCFDNTACTIDRCDDETGTCFQEPLVCGQVLYSNPAFPSFPCYSSICDAQTDMCLQQCNFGTCNEGAGPCALVQGCRCQADCADNDLCTINSCESFGLCSSVQRLCRDGDACTNDFCDKNVGCVHEPRQCDDGNECTEDSCDERTINGCINTPIDDCMVPF